MTKFFGAYNMIIVRLSSFLHPIMVVQSYIIHRDKINKKLQYCFELKCYRAKTSKARSIRDKYRRQFMLTAAVKMDHNQNTITAINHQRAIRIKLYHHS